MASFVNELRDELNPEDTDQLSPLVTMEQARQRILRMGGRRRPNSLSETVQAIRRTRTLSRDSEKSYDSDGREIVPDISTPRWENPFRQNTAADPPPTSEQEQAEEAEDAIVPAPPDPEPEPLGPNSTIPISGFGGSLCCHPQRFLHRMMALILMCLLGFGSYFCFDNPGALQEEIKETMHITTYQFANLYSWYSWPNVVLPFLGGYLMDSVFGIRIGTIIFAFFIILGQAMFALGGFNNSFSLMQMGRFCFGIGGESLAVAQNTYAVSWFQGKELNMVFGFQLSIARVGSTVNFLTMAPLYEYLTNYYIPTKALGWTLAIGGMTCIMSFICAIALGVMDKRAEVLVRNKLKAKKGGGKEESVMHPKDVLDFPATFWFLSFICLAYYVAVFPFISLGQVFFMKKFGFNKSNANFINGLIYLLSAPASPILGFLMDKTGRNITYCFLSILLTLVSHALLAFSFINPYVGVVLLGLAYSLLASALWPIAAFIIPEHQLGSAYGLMQAIQNMGLGIVTLAAGLIVDKHGYLWLELFFIAWLVIAMICIVVIYVLDIKGSGYLNMGISARAAYDEEQERLAREAEKEKGDAPKDPRILKPRTASELRERYLCRIGAILPPHMGHGGLNIVRNADGSERNVEDRVKVNSINNIRPRLRLHVENVSEEATEAVNP